MADLWSTYASQLPMGASSRGAIVGQTEWGSPVYASPTGVQYWEPLQGETKRGSVARALLDGMRSDPWGAVKSGAGAVASGVAEALSAPYRAWKGEALTNGDVFNAAGIAQLGTVPMSAPAGSLRSGLPGGWFPYSDFLDAPPTPTAEQMRSLGRLESVPVEQLRATNRSQWGRFNSGEHPPELIPGFNSRPVAVRMNNGEYLIYDGHHRSALGAGRGDSTIDMDVIDAKDYAPHAAGRARPESKGYNSGDDDLLNMLFGE